MLVLGWNIKINEGNYILKEEEITTMPYPAKWTRAGLGTEHKVPRFDARQKAYVQGPQQDWFITRP
jgi:hypothetical protein